MSPINRTITLRDVLVGVRQRNQLDDEGLSRIENHLGRYNPSVRDSWFIKVLLAIGAWVAAIFFIVSLEVADLVVFFSWQSLIGWGIAFLIAATVLRRLSNHIFTVHSALALSCAGHILVLVGVADLSWLQLGTFSVTAAAMILCAALYPTYPDNLHRFLSCTLASVCLVACILHSGVWRSLHLEMLFKIIIIGIVFMYRRDLVILRPLGYAMAISLPASLLLVLAPEEWSVAPWWPTNIVLAVSLIWLYQWVAGGWSRLRAEPMALAVTATVCLASVTTPGILAALGLMILGYATNDRFLLFTGLLFFPIFIVVSYYDLDLSLLVKSWMMLGTGAVLLTARGLLRLRGWTDGLT